MHLSIRTTVLPIRTAAILAIAALVAACGGASVPAPSATTAPGASAAVVADPALAELRIDYATYSPPSLVLKKLGSLEQALPGTPTAAPRSSEDRSTRGPGSTRTWPQASSRPEAG